MKHLSVKNILLPICLLIYSYLFWQHKLGINLSAFTVLLLAVNFYLNPRARRSNPAIFTAACTVFTAIFFTVNHTGLNGFMVFLSFFICTGFIHIYRSQYIPSIILQTLYSFTQVPVVWLDKLQHLPGNTQHISPLWRFVRRGLIPFLIFFIFYMIYSIANPVFGKMASMFTSNIFIFFEWMFSFISLPYFFFLLLGLIILTAVLFYRFSRSLFKAEATESEFLARKQQRLPKILRSPYYTLPERNPVALKNEARTATWLLILVNLLLLVVNCIDISWIWLGFNMPHNFNLKQFVHEGTYLLILSILLSIGILLYFFRANLNFYKGNKIIIRLAHIWILQNMVLTFSVFLRNWHYIQFHGLAYKRIGVMIFLLLTLIGLATLFIKIKQKRSDYFLWRTNTWAAYTVLVLFSAVQWDVLIVNYNLNHWNTAGIDTDFYYELDDNTLPLLYSRISDVERQMNAQKSLPRPWAYRTDIEEFRQMLDSRSMYFILNWQSARWQSWNLADARTAEDLEKYNNYFSGN